MFNKFCKSFYRFFNTYGELLLFIAGAIVLGSVFAGGTALFVSVAFGMTFAAAFIKTLIFFGVGLAVIGVICFVSYIYEKGEEITQAERVKEGEHGER